MQFINNNNWNICNPNEPKWWFRLTSQADGLIYVLQAEVRWTSRTLWSWWGRSCWRRQPTWSESKSCETHSERSGCTKSAVFHPLKEEVCICCWLLLLLETVPTQTRQVSVLENTWASLRKHWLRPLSSWGNRVFRKSEHLWAIITVNYFRHESWLITYRNVSHLLCCGIAPVIFLLGQQEQENGCHSHVTHVYGFFRALWCWQGLKALHL